MHTILDTDNSGKGVLKTSFDNVQVLGNREQAGFFLQFDMNTECKKTLYADYTPCLEGEMCYRASVKLNTICFDISADGFLIVIGMDGDKFWIDQKTGNLMFNMTDEEEYPLFSPGEIRESNQLKPYSVLTESPV